MSFTITNARANKAILNGHSVEGLGAITLDALAEDAVAAVAAGEASIAINAADSSYAALMAVNSLTDSSGGTSATAASGVLIVPTHGANSTATLVTAVNALIGDMKNMWSAIASLQKQLNQNQIVEQ